MIYQLMYLLKIFLLLHEFYINHIKWHAIYFTTNLRRSPQFLVFYRGFLTLVPVSTPRKRILQTLELWNAIFSAKTLEKMQEQIIITINFNLTKIMFIPSKNKKTKIMFKFLAFFCKKRFIAFFFIPENAIMCVEYQQLRCEARCVWEHLTDLTHCVQVRK